ncbi:hypothetical protein G3I55_46040, partial [Streptomyces sp. SID6648]|nr:hypothetical protein [Streptomyces sp. SID6648]
VYGTQSPPGKSGPPDSVEPPPPSGGVSPLDALFDGDCVGDSGGDSVDGSSDTGGASVDGSFEGGGASVDASWDGDWLGEPELDGDVLGLTAAPCLVF